MKKLFAIMLIVLVVCISAIGCEKTNSSNDETVVYSNIDDYADCNGYKGWSYFCGDIESELYPMVYTPFLGKYRDNIGEGFVQKDIWQPSVNNEIMICFTSQQDGKTLININVELLSVQETGSDGVAFYLSKDMGNSYIYTKTLRNDTLFAKETIEFEMKNGDSIYFVLSAINSSQNDKTKVDIRIHF
jgi:hypothetical protein